MTDSKCRVIVHAIQLLLEGVHIDTELATALATFLRRVEPVLGEAAAATRDLAATLDRLGQEPNEASVPATPAPEPRGPRQKQIVDVLAGHEDEEGMKTGEVASAISMDQPNAYTTLQALQNQGIVEMVPGVQPQRWRLAAQFRRSRRIIEAANAVRPGEWTSYGEISMLTYGHHRGGLAVGRVVSTSPDVENAHRVLEFNGHISEWWSGEGGGSDECQRRLEAEGVEVSADQFAHGRHFVGHEQLAERLTR